MTVYHTEAMLRKEWPTAPNLFNWWWIDGFEIPEANTNPIKYSLLPRFHNKVPDNLEAAFDFVHVWSKKPGTISLKQSLRLSPKGLAAAHYLVYSTGLRERYYWPKSFLLAVELFKLRFEVLNVETLAHDYQDNVPGKIRAAHLKTRSFQLINVDCRVTAEGCEGSEIVKSISGFLLQNV